MDLGRALRHLFTPHRAVARVFPDASMQAIERGIAEEEKRHAGEIQFAVESALPLIELLRGTSARRRAIGWFARLHVWDTAHNSGVLIYLLLADRRIEIVADRGISAKVDGRTWELICGEMQREFAKGRFQQGVVLGIRAIGDVLAAHFPARGGPNPNELPDKPVVL
ncbi:MAG TPA: TPM domain-containing protein [Burkholderiales bacterium]